MAPPTPPASAQRPSATAAPPQHLSRQLALIFIIFALLLADLTSAFARRGGKPQLQRPGVPPDSDWARRVRFRAWEGLAPDDPRLCVHAQRDILPRPRASDPLGACPDFPDYATGPTPSWRTLGGRLMAVDCLYAGSRSATPHFLRLPSPNASVYLVFVQAGRPGEGAEERRLRLALSGNTLGRLREQFGLALEITLVELFETSLDFDAIYGAGTVNTAIMGVNAAGQDWAMYQEGIHAVWHRAEQFEWIVVMNDVMVGPVARFDDVLRQAAAGATELYLTSNWGGCCMRGFLLGFHRRLVATAKWRDFWQRVSFPCGKLGAMFVGEAQLSMPPLSWGASCLTSTQHPLSKTDSFAVMLASRSPFLYRTGLVAAFTEDNATDLPRLLDFINTHEQEPHTEACGGYTIFTK